MFDEDSTLLNGSSAAALSEVISLSHHFGNDPAFVLAGGGNTSCKTQNQLWVKASGHALATISEHGFVALDRSKLEALFTADWPTDVKSREAAFLDRVLAARVHPEQGQRPSVETLLHHLLPSRLVVHTHPGLINAVTCCDDGERSTRALFDDDVLWQPYVDPGLRLAHALKCRLESAAKRPVAIFLENHGLIVAGDSAEEIEQRTAYVVGVIRSHLGGKPAVEVPSTDEQRLRTALASVLNRCPKLSSVMDTSPASVWLAGTTAGRDAAFGGPLTPDQIVYCRSVPLFLRDTDASHVSAAWAEYEGRFGMEPWTAVVENAGVLAFRSSAAMAETTRAVFVDAAAVSMNAYRLGGVRALSPEYRRFIEEWEVEAYRRSVAARANL